MAARGTIVVSVLLLTSCWGDPGTDRENVAFMAGGEGQLLALTCAGIEPESVGVWRIAGNNKVVGDDGDLLLESISPASFEPGPLGLRQAQMSAAFDKAEVSVMPGGAIRLDAANLPSGEVVLTDQRVMSVEQFAMLASRQDDCQLDGDR